MDAKVYEALVKVIAIWIVCIPLMFLGAWFLELLWNWLMPVLFGLPEVTYWQALGLRLLSTFLLGSRANVDTK